jgi:mannose-6-phosphate isomerase-like protein (cupin superfamily)
MHITLAAAQNALLEGSSVFQKLFAHGSLIIEIYKPHETDNQTPHQQDEVYIIISGSGKFLNGSDVVSFLPGDFLFVPAGQEHRFFDFSDDFSTWVIFYGPTGGESGFTSKD